MLPRRRRTGSDSEPLVIVGNNRYWTQSQSINTSENRTFPNNAPIDYLVEDILEDYFETEPVMTARDRTSEFINTIQTLQGRNITRAVAARDLKKSKLIQNHSVFMLIAKNVGKNIVSTYAKLEKLTLCKYILYFW